MTLTELVPTLEVCQQLKAAGFPQDTAMYWQRSTMHIDHPVSVHVKGDNEIGGIGDFFEDICAAPTAGELMEWIVAKYPACALEVLWSDDEWEIDLANDLPRICQGVNSKGSLVSALAALILEVAG